MFVGGGGQMFFFFFVSGEWWWWCFWRREGERGLAGQRDLLMLVLALLGGELISCDVLLCFFFLYVYGI